MKQFKIPIVCGIHFGIGFALGILICNSSNCEPWFTFLISLIGGVLSNLLFSILFERQKSSASIIKMSGGKLKVDLIVKETKKSTELAFGLLRYSKPRLSIHERWANFINWDLNPKDQELK